MRKIQSFRKCTFR